MAGESYAGKYIPDLANNIIGYNAENPSTAINLKGLLIANGAFTFEGL
jgi:carboxypeptidase C (cathepsin A)